MFKRYFELVENVELGPIISLVIFFSFFLMMTIWLFRADKGFISKMKNMPLDNQNESDPKAEKDEQS